MLDYCPKEGNKTAIEHAQRATKPTHQSPTRDSNAPQVTPTIRLHATMSAKRAPTRAHIQPFCFPSTSGETRTRTPNRATAFEAGVSTIPPHWHRKRHPALSRAASTSGGTRTHTPQRAPDFESGMSTNSITEAKEKGSGNKHERQPRDHSAPNQRDTRTPAAPPASPTRVRGHSQPANPDRPQLTHQHRERPGANTQAPPAHTQRTLPCRHTPLRDSNRSRERPRVVSAPRSA